MGEDQGTHCAGLVSDLLAQLLIKQFLKEQSRGLEAAALGRPGLEAQPHRHQRIGKLTDHGRASVGHAVRRLLHRGEPVDAHVDHQGDRAIDQREAALPVGHPPFASSPRPIALTVSRRPTRICAGIWRTALHHHVAAASARCTPIRRERTTMPRAHRLHLGRRKLAIFGWSRQLAGPAPPVAGGGAAR